MNLALINSLKVGDLPHVETSFKNDVTIGVTISVLAIDSIWFNPGKLTKRAAGIFSECSLADSCASESNSPA